MTLASFDITMSPPGKEGHKMNFTSSKHTGTGVAVLTR